MDANDGALTARHSSTFWGLRFQLRSEIAPLSDRLKIEAGMSAPAMEL